MSAVDPGHGPLFKGGPPCPACGEDCVDWVVAEKPCRVACAEIIGAAWMPWVNVLTIRCACGREHEHRADRRWATCPACQLVCDTRDLDRLYRARCEAGTIPV